MTKINFIQSHRDYRSNIKKKQNWIIGNSPNISSIKLPFFYFSNDFYTDQLKLVNN